MAGNSKGSYRSTPQNALRAFDKLPPAARAALANAAFCFAPQPVLTHWKRGSRGMKTGAEVAATIAKWDRDYARKTAKRTWGVDYPVDLYGAVEGR